MLFPNGCSMCGMMCGGTCYTSSYSTLEATPVTRSIPATDIEFSTYNNTPPGGQQVGKTSSAIKAVHLPTGITAIVDTERSQFKNKEITIIMLEAGLAALTR